MDVKAVSTRLVKPRSPTPNYFRHYKISFMDELNPTINVVGILYYQSPAATSENLEQLQESLSEILPSFYPFAGRYMKNDLMVDCNDKGALLIEADVNLELAEVIKPDSKLGDEELNDLLPCKIGAADDDETDPILQVQFNKFKCGGLAISICISHRVIDACSLGRTFLSAWTNVSRGDNREAICPSFDGPVFFPGKNFFPAPAPEFRTTRARANGLYSIICKRFLFDRNTILGLKDSITNGKSGEHSPPPSRVGVVSGLVIQAIAGADRAIDGRARDLVVAQAINIRERTVPSLSKHSCGNLVALTITERTAEETKEMGLEDLVRVLGNDARKTVRDCARLLSENGHRSWIQTFHDASEKSLREDVNVVWVADWSKFGFYEADFGWGKPVWASVANLDVVKKNHVLLMSTKEGDGIETWVQLEESVMPHFEKEILSLQKYPSSNIRSCL